MTYYLICSLQNTTTKENETLLAIGTAYVQGEDVAARGRILLFSLGKDSDNSQNLVIYQTDNHYLLKSISCLLL